MTTIHDVLELLFDKTEKIVAWAAMVVLTVAILSIASCSENMTNTRHETLHILIDKGYHPLVVNCIMEGWQVHTERLVVCMDAFEKYPGQQDAVQGELGID